MTLHDNKPFLPTISQQASQVFGPLQREIDRVFTDFSRSIGAGDLWGLSLSLDYSETDAGIEITAELPGLKESDIKVTLDDDILTISGQKKSETKDKSKNYHVVERRYGSFSRSIRVPRGIQAEQIKATLSDGLLKVTAPTPPKDEARTIAVHTAEPEAGA